MKLHTEYARQLDYTTYDLCRDLDDLLLPEDIYEMLESKLFDQNRADLHTKISELNPIAQIQEIQ